LQWALDNTDGTADRNFKASLAWATTVLWFKGFFSSFPLFRVPNKDVTKAWHIYEYYNEEPGILCNIHPLYSHYLSSQDGQ
jgi:hypothetical protein